ncbi:MAG: tRNA (adenosine(37)-N6)-threonylcarbamoyltransferase complex dimerization subunit type 1 TsaB [Vampirovibrionales bacterium]|nr:tRNA (adenosine(37)-N6)-threonylcarbamoyltransferase complex dimerization subunit type 1 TsaB [Vampirovibrionales bacterium]
MAEMRALLLDTAGATLMAAIAVNGEILARLCEESPSQRYHSAALAAKLRTMLESLALTPQDLTALAVHIGPGSFTGLRTGLTTARVMGQFLPLTCYAFTAFDLLRAAQPPDDAPLGIALDALQGRAYAAICDASGAWRQPPALVTLDAWRDSLPAGARALISASLASAWDDSTGERRRMQPIESLGLFTPQLMMDLVTRGAPSTPWGELLPLYLQSPNITLRADASSKKPPA